MNRKTKGTEQKLWIIGDSFTSLRYDKESWQLYLYENFVGKNMYISSKGSRDTQTIFDIFLQNIHKINPNDVVILFLPSLIRFRLPLKYPYCDVEYSSDELNSETYQIPMSGMLGNEQLTSNIATTAQEIERQSKLTLESPLDELDFEVFESNYSKSKILNFANITQMINCSKVFTDNWNMILKSIQLYVPFKLIYYSWANELDSSIVNTKDVIINELGFWETLSDVWLKTDGQSGIQGDPHWTDTMDKAFAEHIIKSYPQYFDYESKTF